MTTGHLNSSGGLKALLSFSQHDRMSYYYVVQIVIRMEIIQWPLAPQLCRRARFPCVRHFERTLSEAFFALQD